MTYQLDNQWRQERERLAILEAFADPPTIARFEAIGVGAGWRCLEIGGGGGSVAQWLCRQVGPAGRVCATDIDTRFLEAIDEPNLDVRCHDIVADGLEESSFDLVHARAVLEHLPGRQTALRKMVAALKQGGWLLLEDGDFVSFVQLRGGNEPLYERVSEAFWRFVSAAGFDLNYGRNLGCLLREEGLEEVQVEGFLSEWGGERPTTQIWLLAWQQMRDRVVEAGLATDGEVDEFLSLVQRPDFVALGPIVFAAWGRKAR